MSKSSPPTSSPASKGNPTLSSILASDPPPKEIKTGKIDRALSLLSACSRPSRSPSPISYNSQDTLLHAYNILDVTLTYYLPEASDPDEASVREKCKRDDATLDELITPLVLLITRLCIGDEASRARLRDWLIPLNLDRTSPLEARPDALGRCLRLLGSVHHANLSKAIGEMMYAMCDSDGKYGIDRTTLPPNLMWWLKQPRFSHLKWAMETLRAFYSIKALWFPLHFHRLHRTPLMAPSPPVREHRSTPSRESPNIRLLRWI